MDVKTAEMTGALDNVYSTSIDNNEVTNLLNEMRDQTGIIIKDEIKVGEDKINAPTAVQTNDMDAMQAKLNDLKNMWEVLEKFTRSIRIVSIVI